MFRMEKEYIEFKKEFVERYKHLLGDEYSAFKEYSNKYINRAIRVNTLKTSVEDLKVKLDKNWNLRKVPWCEEGFWLSHKSEERFDIGNIPEHQLGYFYIQDPASMLPGVILKPKPGEMVLDMCSAPGSKTSHLAMYMENEGIIQANDSDGKRLSALGINLQKLGIHNTIITKMQGQHLKQGGFDKILVDAPCSGTGTIRRNFKIAKMWSPSMVKSLKGLQYKLLEKAYELTKPNGNIVYSTCTLEPEENEGVVSKLLENHNASLENINVDIKRQPAIKEFEGIKYKDEVEKCLRINPQDNDTEGFFVARIKKK